MEKPPSMQMVAPATKSDARDAKKTAVPGHSSGLPKRPVGVRVMISSYKAGASVFTGAVMSVSILVFVLAPFFLVLVFVFGLARPFKQG
jgi:hypothetical protein